MPTAKASVSKVTILASSWFTRPTCVVAADLVGKILCRQLIDSDGNVKTLRLRISETEAYIGDEDGSVQVHVGTRTKRGDIMYEQGGIFYIYLTYGVHHMLNLVSGKAQSPESVLIRAGFLIDNSDHSDADSSTDNSGNNKKLTPVQQLKQFAGPGKLTKHLQIDRTLSGLAIDPESNLWIEDDECTPPVSLRPRIGIDYAGEAKDWLLRYVWTDHPSLSKK
ncbi:DNA-3-methyladenine glycosylase [uncultured Psychrobacter sp.]|uniref:DNA-3-methyladenine glycosylase n=1 Tax=uncultured Psychrobacter sp. TaxID=259303 RepID=UPI00345AE98B